MKLYNKITTCFFTVGIISLLFVGCRGSQTDLDDTPQRGTIHISVDESFKPIIDEHIKMYEATYPEATIIAHYKPEAECLRDFIKDSATRMVIVTRGLNYKEEKFFKDSMNYYPRWDKVANDAIAIVVNNKSTDTLFTIDRLKQQLSGKWNKNQSIVFDGLNATSTVRYAIDSILDGGKFDTSVVRAVNNSQAVLDYIATHEDAIGLVGISWIGNPEDVNQLAMLKQVKIAYIQCDACEEKPYVKPNQLTMMRNRYPLVRGLYYIVKENYTGLGTGFANFLQYERGQLIFKRAYLVPTKVGFSTRNVKLNEKLATD